MRVIFFGAVLAIGTVCTMPKKDKNISQSPEQAKLADGYDQSPEMNQPDIPGLGYSDVKFGNGSLSFSFDEAGRSETLTGNQK